MRFDELFNQVMEFPIFLPEDKDQSTSEPSPDQAEDEPQKQESPIDLMARQFPGGGGVYLLTDQQDRMIQLASAGDLRRALRGKLLEPQHLDKEQAGTFARKRADLSQITRKIRWKPAHSMFEINYEYQQLARILLPDNYLDNLSFGPSWFIHVDPAADIPRFTVNKTLKGCPGMDLGPFATNKDATRFVEILEDAFDLCRYYHIIEQAPHGQTCVYHEMGRCPAPCDGSIPMSQYREMISSALDFACGRRAEAEREWQTQMQQAADEMAYERAGTIKQKLEKVQELNHQAYRFVRPIKDFSYLIIQRGGGRTKIKPFFVQAGAIIPGDIVKLKEIDKAVNKWIGIFKNDQSAKIDSSALQERSEQIWLVSHYLFKREKPGLFLHHLELNDPNQLTEHIHEQFTPKASTPDKEQGTTATNDELGTADTRK